MGSYISGPLRELPEGAEARLQVFVYNLWVLYNLARAPLTSLWLSIPICDMQQYQDYKTLVD